MIVYTWKYFGKIFYLVGRATASGDFDTEWTLIPKMYLR